MRTGLTCVLVIIGLVAFFGVMTINVQAANPEVWVDDDAADTWYNESRVRTIQEGVDNVSVDGTVYVRDGLYCENVDVAKRVAIQSENGSANCIVNASNRNDHVFDVSVDRVTIEGFTIQKAKKSGKAAIFIDNADYCNISGNICTNNWYGIYLDWYSDDCNISGNACNENEYGIRLEEHCCRNKLIGNIITNSGDVMPGGNGDGITLYNACNSNNITGNTVSGSDKVGIVLGISRNNIVFMNTCNDNEYDGIHLYAASNSNKIRKNTCSGNKRGGGITIASSDSKENNISENTCSNNADGIHLVRSKNNTYFGNICSSNTRRGIYMQYGKNNTLRDNICSDNTAGIRLRSSARNNTLSGNTCIDNTYGIRLSNAHDNNVSFCQLSNTIDLYTHKGSTGNQFYRNTFSSYPTTATFTCNGTINISGVTTPPTPPAGMAYIDKCLNITSTDANAWINLTIYYEDTDIGNATKEATLRLWKYNESWHQQGWFSWNKTDTTTNQLAANITTIGSIYTPLYKGDNKPTTADVPVLSPFGLLLLTVMMSLLAVVALRKRHR